MKIYFVGSGDSTLKLLLQHGDIAAHNGRLDQSHVLVVDGKTTAKNIDNIMRQAQELMKPILFLTKSGNKKGSKPFLNSYPFITIGEYKTNADLKKLVDTFFKEYGTIAKEANNYCCGGGCCGGYQELL